LRYSSRLPLFDERGTGLSDPVSHASTLEENVEDLGAVMDAARSERADVGGVSEGGAMPPCSPRCIPNARIRSRAGVMCAVLERVS
jgi:hypothetical protein